MVVARSGISLLLIWHFTVVWIPGVLLYLLSTFLQVHNDQGFAHNLDADVIKVSYKANVIHGSVAHVKCENQRVGINARSTCRSKKEWFSYSSIGTIFKCNTIEMIASACFQPTLAPSGQAPLTTVLEDEVSG